MFLPLVSVYWFFTPEIKLSIKILIGILNLFAVVALVCAIVLNLSLYFLIPAAIVYGSFLIASCIHVGLRRYNENVEYQEFVNPYDEIMTYLKQGQIKPPKSVNDKIQNINIKKQEIEKNDSDSKKDSNELE